MKIERILVPTDFSETSQAALQYARELTDKFQASLHILNVVLDPYTQPWALEGFGPALPDLLNQFKAEAEKTLATLLPEVDRKRLNAHLVLRVGSPAAEIVQYSRDAKIDLIVMGTHGRGGVAHALLGSVAERVVRLARCPVLTVRGSQGAAGSSTKVA